MKGKIIRLLSYILVISITIGCSWIIADKKCQECYDNGYNDGHNTGYDSGYSSGYSQGKADESSKNADLINFVDRIVVFCTDKGEKYHKFNCPHFQNNRDSVYVFNISYAKSLGYEPCQDCFGSNSINSLFGFD